MTEGIGVLEEVGHRRGARAAFGSRVDLPTDNATAGSVDLEDRFKSAGQDGLAGDVGSSSIAQGLQSDQSIG